MTKPLDPRFVKIIALMRSTQHAGEKAAARKKAETIANACGMSFDEAVRALDNREAPQAANGPRSFDDFMEEKEPGYKARRSAERSEKERQGLARRAAIIARYGSEEAAIAPCAREQMLRKALAPWIVLREKPWQRWTESVDGYKSFLDKLPDHIRDAVANAYPLPTTFQEAKAEHDYWDARDAEIADVLDDPAGYSIRGEALDRVAQIRADMIRDLAERDIPVSTIKDLHARFKMYRGMECNDEKIEAALFRDLEAMVLREDAHPSYVSTNDNSAESHLSTSDHGQKIAESLRGDPSQSDRQIARAMGCSPTTVGKIRREIGLSQGLRSVQRRGRIYSMKFTEQRRS